MGGITVIDALAEVLPEQGVPQVPEVGQVRGEVVLLLLRHNGQFFLTTQSLGLTTHLQCANVPAQ